MSTVEDYSDIVNVYDPSCNTTNNRLTKYEIVKIIGVRAEQLARGAPSTVDCSTNDPIQIAQEELKRKTIPFMIKRNLPNGKTEIWRLKDMDASEEYIQ